VALALNNILYCTCWGIVLACQSNEMKIAAQIAMQNFLYHASGRWNMTILQILFLEKNKKVDYFHRLTVGQMPTAIKLIIFVILDFIKLL